MNGSMPEHPLKIIDRLLSEKPETADQCGSFADWKACYYLKTASLNKTADMAVTGGFYADRVAFAFAAGYHAALQNLVPDLPKETITAFCVTEEGGGHPRMINSRLDPLPDDHASGWRLNGRKQFVTCADEAEMFLVAASTGMAPDGKNNIRIVRVKRNTPGLRINVMDDLPFVPEISHGMIELNDIALTEEQMLPGDGYTRYIKPFRTLEDLHVNAAILGYLFRIARQFKWPRPITEQILSLIVTTQTLAECDPSLPEVHIAFGGLFAQTTQLIAGLDSLWAGVSPDIHVAWKRDEALLNIAGKARAIRLDSAWQHYRDP